MPQPESEHPADCSYRGQLGSPGSTWLPLKALVNGRDALIHSHCELANSASNLAKLRQYGLAELEIMTVMVSSWPQHHHRHTELGPLSSLLVWKSPPLLLVPVLLNVKM
ncbi:hypothetical protein D5086_012760 [Populus alba]|uniref:Uncharacterized protein n=1 Tax=Populus alba TaxID=43335 RepID=A0ACC4C3T7_POPAL